jgi:hypothetical protein
MSLRSDIHWFVASMGGGGDKPRSLRGSSRRLAGHGRIQSNARPRVMPAPKLPPTGPGRRRCVPGHVLARGPPRIRPTAVAPLLRTANRIPPADEVKASPRGAVEASVAR